MEENEFGALDDSPTEVQEPFQVQMHQEHQHQHQQSQPQQPQQHRQVPQAPMGGQRLYADTPQYEATPSYLNAGVGLHGGPMGMHGGPMAPSLGVVGYGHQ